ncbi:MAG: hypothetical protein Q9167_006079 [Letrouitia subvulpina]
MSILTVYEMVPQHKLATYGALISVSIALATVTGPLFGGLIDKSSTWRWVFYFKNNDFSTTFLVGVPFNVVIVSLPQRFQAVSNTSALGAGIRLIPYSVVAALGSAIANVVCAKARIPLLYFLLVGAVLHVLGLTLLSTVSSAGPFPVAGYGYEVLAGAGVGITFGILILAVPYTVEARDLAVATGAVIQFRFLGGAIGLSIVSSVLNGMLKSQLRGVLPARELAALLESTEVISTFTPTVKNKVLEVFVQNYQVQFRIMIGFAAAQIPAAALLWRRGEQFRAA